ncbi:metalloregulator ArsR/SmtB family transcription factor [Nonomuraea sp. NPDC049607]|uniref:ArsR/SmtB family transcription factor n=1 Tax=Nonomuraea sp. NPDC049607 TaxID=3154732 RepID=UPI00342DA59A
MRQRRVTRASCDACALPSRWFLQLLLPQREHTKRGISGKTGKGCSRTFASRATSPAPGTGCPAPDTWFKALADATRIQIVSLLARRRAPMSVGEIVAASGVGQSTVSHHLKILAEVRFVLVERQGTSSLYRINENCVSCFPTAADVVMGKPVPAAPTCE